ncbi:MAG: alkaline phosphatase family protein [Phycisphaerae bacterium]|jgi:predicted AlkP superfamily phosphohydrolase/phosphomutase
MTPLRRPTFTSALLLVIAMALTVSSCREEASEFPTVVVLGFDGMDPILCERMMNAGELPHLDKMRRQGGYKPLGTTIPPQSPVAWASFITGANPGVHGIYDFIHRDPSKQCAPFYAAAKTEGGEEGWDVGEYKVPLTFWPFNHAPTQTLLRRGGTPFWDYLDQAGVPTWIYDIPANYPPSPSHHGHVCCLAGMGVPDLLGGYGTYQHFSEATFRIKREPGGMRKPLIFRNNIAKATLTGPENTLLKEPKPAEAEFLIYRHPTEPMARIELQGETAVLTAGEWSDWQQVDFELETPSFLPTTHVSGIVRFYLQEVRPNFRLYVTPVNIDPSDPGEQKITEPQDFITEISDELGLFYTAGFQEDHKALSNEVFADREYDRQADHVLAERLEMLGFAQKHYTNGLLFFYFSSTDLQAHMFWWDSDEPHPVRSPEEARTYHQKIVELYRQMDDVVGKVTERYGDKATIIVMSDHGFCNFRRQFNLNTWLRDNGYVQPRNCKSLLDPRRGRMVDWGATRAYGLGLNGLYVNLQGRELKGIVPPKTRDALLDEIAEKLLAVRDPENGKPVIAKVYRRDEVYSGPLASTAPDLIVGYHRGYRASWATTLGDMTDEVISDNDSAWSADHCIAADQVPGVVFSNKPILRDRPSLVDVAPTVLELFGVDTPPTMEGGSLFESGATASAD